MKKILKGFVAASAVAATMSTLAACVPANAEKAKAKLENKNYDVVVLDGKASEVFGIKGVEKFLTATKTDDNNVEIVGAYYFESTSAAKDAYEKIEKLLKNEDKDAYVKRSGKVIYGGTQTAVKDFD